MKKTLIDSFVRYSQEGKEIDLFRLVDPTRKTLNGKLIQAKDVTILTGKNFLLAQAHKLQEYANVIVATATKLRFFEEWLEPDRDKNYLEAEDNVPAYQRIITDIGNRENVIFLIKGTSITSIIHRILFHTALSEKDFLTNTDEERILINPILFDYIQNKKIIHYQSQEALRLEEKNLL
jgi:hypothetical protein